MVGEGGADLSSEFVGSCLVEAILEQQVILANDGILDEAVAGLGNLLLVLVPGTEFTRVADGDRARESIAEFDPVEQVLDRHAQLDIVNISWDEHGLDNPATP